MASVLETDKASLLDLRPASQRAATGKSSGQGDAFRKTLGASSAASQDTAAEQPPSQAGTAGDTKTASHGAARSSKPSNTSGTTEATSDENNEAGSSIPLAVSSAGPEAIRTQGPAGESLPASLQTGMTAVAGADAGQETGETAPVHPRPHTDILPDTGGASEAATSEAAPRTDSLTDRKAATSPDPAAAAAKAGAAPDQVKAAAPSEATQAAPAETDTLTPARASAHTDSRIDTSAASAAGQPDKAAMQLSQAGLSPGGKAGPSAATHGKTQRLAETSPAAGETLQTAAAPETRGRENDAKAVADPAIAMTSLSEAIDQKAASAATLDGGATGALTGTDGGLQVLHGQAPGGAAPAAPTLPAPPATQAMPAAQTQATLVAAPEEIVDIVSQKPSRADGRDRIMVQLDPPELGRISLDFKFDGQGLQHVTITGETPEAMRRLRLMHNELVQALEQHGLSGQDMSFQEQAQRQWNSHQARPVAAQGMDEAEMIAAPAVALKPTLTRITSSGLDIRL